jgi:hypothetical protein
LSFLSSVRNVFHRTPILRQVSQGFANSFGLGKAYAEYDAKIGIGADGEPVPQTTGEGQSAFGVFGSGQPDLAEWAAQRFPNTAALVDQYRREAPSFRGGGYRAMPAELPVDQGDEDFIDEEQ